MQIIQLRIDYETAFSKYRTEMAENLMFNILLYQGGEN